MQDYHLAQYNIAWLVAPLDDPRLADFRDNLDLINGLAERSAGFVWRHQTADGDSTAIRIRDEDRILINFSLWESTEALFAFAFHSDHTAYYRRRREWFSHEEEPYAVLWWVPAGHEPTVDEAEERLQFLKEHGSTAEAFTFTERFSAPVAEGVR